MNVIRANKITGTRESLSMLGATVVLGRLFNKTRAEIEAELLSGGSIETLWYIYQVEEKA